MNIIVFDLSLILSLLALVLVLVFRKLENGRLTQKMELKMEILQNDCRCILDNSSKIERGCRWPSLLRHWASDSSQPRRANECVRSVFLSFPLSERHFPWTDDSSLRAKARCRMRHGILVKTGIGVAYRLAVDQHMILVMDCLWTPPSPLHGLIWVRGNRRNLPELSDGTTFKEALCLV